MVKLVFLTEDFFDDYRQCKEIERKADRPHIQVFVKVKGVVFCIPMRSHITHSHALFTDKRNRCGVDFSKAVVISDVARYIDGVRRPYIRGAEFASIKKVTDYELERRMLAYIAEYKEAKKRMDIPRNRVLVQCSTLQYFEKYI